MTRQLAAVLAVSAMLGAYMAQENAAQAGSCVVEMHGRQAFSGPCAVSTASTGVGLRISAAGGLEFHLAFLDASEKTASLSWRPAGKNNHQRLGPVGKLGNCWVNRLVRLCL